MRVSIGCCLFFLIVKACGHTGSTDMRHFCAMHRELAFPAARYRVTLSGSLPQLEYTDLGLGIERYHKWCIRRHNWRTKSQNRCALSLPGIGHQIRKGRGELAGNKVSHAANRTGATECKGNRKGTLF